MTDSQKTRFILYAESNIDARFMVAVLLGFSCINVTFADSVAEAWLFKDDGDFDLYLLDSWFPDGSGLDLCRRLRAHSRLTPIIFYSEDAFETDREDGLAAGADAYLAKPYIENLTEKIFQTLNVSGKSFVETDQKMVAGFTATAEF